MRRPMIHVALASLVLLAGGGAQFLLGCEVIPTCPPARQHPGHLDEYGNLDDCCDSAVPCCTNPLWGRWAKKNGYEILDPCCIEVPCPAWDVNKGADAGPDGEVPEADASASPDAGAEEDAGTDGGR